MSDRAGVIQLHLVRHADAGDPDAWEGDDDERPLSDKGRRQSERLGRFLAAIAFRPDAIVSSPKARAAQTAEVLAGRLGVDMVVDERLASDLGLGHLDPLLRGLGAQRPVLVGHDPDFSALVAILCGASRVPMKKGALVRIDIERPIQPGAGALRWLLPPSLLRSEE